MALFFISIIVQVIGLFTGSMLIMGIGSIGFFWFLISEYFNGKKAVNVLRKKHNVPDVYYSVDIRDISVRSQTLCCGPCWIWKERDVLKIVSPNEKLTVINIQDITVFARVGDIKHVKSSLGKAVMGDVLFGTGGALIGSQAKEIDNRITMLFIQDKGIESYYMLSPESYEVFLKLIPNKEHNLIQKADSPSQQESIHQQQTNSNLDNLKALEQLADLKAKGIITEDEFSAKKKQLLGL